MSDEPNGPFWLTRDEAGTPVINGQLLRFDMFCQVQVAYTDTAPEVPLEYLEAAHRWILDGKLPARPKLTAVK